MTNLTENPRRAFDPFAPHYVPGDQVEDPGPDLDAMSVKELREHAAAHGIEVPKKASRAELIETITAAKEAPVGFPRKRFQEAGATPAELDALEAEHQALPDALRAANEQHFATLDTDGLRDALESRRAAGIETGDQEPEGPVRDPEDLAKVSELLAGAGRYQETPKAPRRSRAAKAK